MEIDKFIKKIHSFFSNVLSSSRHYDKKPDTILATNIYGIQVFTVFFGITWIFSLVLSYARLKSVTGTKLEAHYLWQVNTSWICLILVTFGMTFIFLGFYSIGLPILIAVNIWAVYRIIKGYLLIRPEYNIAIA